MRSTICAARHSGSLNQRAVLVSVLFLLPVGLSTFPQISRADMLVPGQNHSSGPRRVYGTKFGTVKADGQSLEIAQGKTCRLDFHGDTKLAEQAKTLIGKMVLVEGFVVQSGSWVDDSFIEVFGLKEAR